MRHTHKSHKKIVLVILAGLLLALGGLAFWYFNKDSQSSKNTEKNDSGINYEPPTEGEKEAGENQKDENANTPEPTPPTNTNGKKQVSVVISDAGQYDDVVEVRSFVPQFYENGTCTITITKGINKVTKTANAYADASSTICTNPEILRSEFPVGGEWSVKVTFDSAGGYGESAVKKIILE